MCHAQVNISRRLARHGGTAIQKRSGTGSLAAPTKKREPQLAAAVAYRRAAGGGGDTKSLRRARVHQ